MERHWLKYWCNFPPHYPTKWPKEGKQEKAAEVQFRQRTPELQNYFKRLTLKESKTYEALRALGLLGSNRRTHENPSIASIGY